MGENEHHINSAVSAHYGATHGTGKEELNEDALI